MGFLDNKDNGAPRDSIYLDIPNDGSKKIVRPLAKTPQTVWVHKINRVEETDQSGQTTIIRGYQTVACTSTGRGGVGCAFCTTQDPLWSKLAPDQQMNKKNLRVDFQKTTVHLMPVFEHTSQSVKIMKSGNQLYQPMDEWYDLQPDATSKDLRRCDWAVWKTGKGVKTQYSSSRLDPAPFEISSELEQAAKDAMTKAMADLRVTPDRVKSVMYGESSDGSVAQAATQAAPQHETPPWAPPAPPAQLPAFQAPAQTVVAPPVPPAPKPAPALTGQQAALKRFIEWINQQPELVGGGMVSNLIPWVREANNGDINYHKLSEAELLLLQTKLEARLFTHRSGN